MPEDTNATDTDVGGDMANTTETPATPTATADTQTQTPVKDNGGLVFPDGNDAEAVLKFRKSCGYPETPEGYGLPMDTDDQKGLAAFLHECQLDGIAAKTVAEKLAARLEAQDAEEQELHDNEVKKVQESWGEQMKAKTDLVNRGAEILQIDSKGLRGMAEAIGTETALNLLIIAGKSTSDYSGVNGTNGGSASEDLDGYISRKRMQR